MLLASYNGARYLPALLDSLRAQTHPWRLLWRDDGSTDATVAMLRASGGRELAAGERLGVLGSFLTLLRHAEGTVAFCDQDDVWLPDKLARAAAALPPDGPCLYCARQILVDSELRKVGESERVRHAGFPAALTQNVAAGCTIVMNPQAARLVAASRPPPGTLHDWWSYLLIAASGGRVMCDPQATILYRQHAANVVGAPAGRRRRAVAAARRGPAAFMAQLRAHVAALLDHEGSIGAEAARSLRLVDAALRRGPAARVSALRLPGLARQTRLETAIFRLWFLFG